MRWEIKQYLHLALEDKDDFTLKKVPIKGKYNIQTTKLLESANDITSK